MATQLLQRLDASVPGSGNWDFAKGVSTFDVRQPKPSDRQKVVFSQNRFNLTEGSRTLTFVENDEVKSTLSEFDRLDVLTSADKYRAVIQNETWRSVFGLKDAKDLAARVGNADQPKSFKDVLPCYFCGIYLPITLIDVDHWNAKEADNKIHRSSALLKSFRAYGLTNDPSKASGKVTALRFDNRNFDLTTRGTADGSRPNSSRAADKSAKYKLNDKGKILFTIIFAICKGNTLLATDPFVNSVLNLVPSCRGCNRSNKQQ